MKQSNTKDELAKEIKTINPSLRIWEIWEAVISAIACILSNALEPDKDVWIKREEEFTRAIQKIGNAEAVCEVLALLIEAVEENPCEDILGEIYMNLGLGDHWKGQYFTPSGIAEMMARITSDEDTILEHVKQNECISVTDPCCGAGVMLLAQAKTLRDMGVNYQTQALYVGQDIDRIVAQMCYIQLTLNGCAGYVCVADSLINPITHDDNSGLIIQPGQEFWFTPFYTLSWLKGKEIEKKQSA